MFARLTKIVLSLPFLIVAGLYVLYLLFGFFLVNPLAQKLLPWIGETKLDSQLGVQRVQFNPFTLEATITGLKLAEKSGQPLAGFDKLYVNLETTGLFRFAWRIKDIELSGPRAEFVVRKGGKFNWDDLFAKLNEGKGKSPPSKTMPRILIDHIKIDNGDIEYRDANRNTAPFVASLQPLGIELDGLSTLPEDRGEYAVAALLPNQGGTLKWDGDVGLNPVKSDGKIALDGVQLPKLLHVIKTPRNFELPSGTLAAGLNYRFAIVKDKPWLQVNGANLVLQKISIASKGSKVPMFELREAKVSDANLDLAARTFKVASISLTGGKLSARRNADGTLDWQTVFATSSSTSPVSPPPAKPVAGNKPADEAAPWKLAINQIKVDDWAARFTDRGFAQPLSVDADHFGLTASLNGEIGATAAIKVSPVNLGFGPLQVFSGSNKTPVASLQKATLSNAAYDLAGNSLGIDTIDLDNFKTSVGIDKRKQINWNQILAKASGAPVAKKQTAAGGDKSAMKLNLGRLSLNGLQVGFSDQATPKPVVLDVVDGHATLKNLSLDLDKPVPVEAGFKIKQGGRFNTDGRVVPGKVKGDLKLKLANLSLKPFGPFINQFARLVLKDGDASTSGRLKFSHGRKGLSLTYNGGFSVDKLAINEEDTGNAFLGWDKLSSNSLRFNLNPDNLHMTELVAVKPFGKVIIYEDKTLNLKRILRSYQPPAETPSETRGTEPAQEANAQPSAEKPGQEAPETETAKAAENVPKPAANEPEQGKEFPLAIDRLRIENGDAEYADLSLPTKFGTRMHSLNGVITGLSTNPSTTAQVELDGSVDQYGSARIRGSIQPFHATDFTDLTLSFHNLEMANLTPYSGKFAGRKIDSGRLSVDLEYKVKNRQLNAQNKFVINKLRLGERVESKDAMHLPLDLAIALLEDSNGVIDIDLPISGNLDNPQFSYGRIIWKAIVNVLTKLVTAPFRALGKLLGISSEKLESIDFDPGSAVLLPPEQEKLKQIAEAFAKRPALALTIEAGYDPKTDRRALQELAMRREAVAVAGIKLAPGEVPGPVDVNNYKIQTWLEDSYIKIAGKDAYQKLRDSYKAKNAAAGVPLMESETMERLMRRFKTRDNGPLSPFHTELLERLTEQTKIDDSVLVKLAQERGQAMREALIKLGVDAGRISIATPSQQTAKGKQVPVKLSLGVGKLPAPSSPAPPAVSPGAASQVPAVPPRPALPAATQVPAASAPSGETGK